MLEAASLVFQWVFVLNTVKHKFFPVRILKSTFSQNLDRKSLIKSCANSELLLLLRWSFFGTGVIFINIVAVNIINVFFGYKIIFNLAFLSKIFLIVLLIFSKNHFSKHFFFVSGEHLLTFLRIFSAFANTFWPFAVSVFPISTIRISVLLLSNSSTSSKIISVVS